jgi:peptidoglycan/xylan/chitin deacetylase (PgdA/CDA1 family)
LARQARDAWEVPRDLLLGRYPEFVTGGALPRGHVPVFVFHSLEPESFERKLRYLAVNGYETLSADEHFQLLMGTRRPPERAVVLSFDDGRGSLWGVGLPLMKRYRAKGVVFLIPGRTPARSGPLPPTWDDVREGRAKPEQVLGREQAEPFLTWEEIEAMGRTGLFEFESHTLSHGRIHTGPQVAGFLTPQLRTGFEAMDVPLVREDGRDRLAHELALGTPLLHSTPRTAEALRFFEDPGLRTACVEVVANGGGEGFFCRAGWRSQLRRLVGRHPIKGEVETAEQRESAIRRELAEAKSLIEAHTGRTVAHLCYPWHASGPTAQRLAHAEGYRTAYAGKVRNVPITLSGGDPHAIARVGEDYLELLPGRGRAELASILRQKLARRLGSRPAGAPWN